MEGCFHLRVSCIQRVREGGTFKSSQKCWCCTCITLNVIQLSNSARLGAPSEHDRFNFTGTSEPNTFEHCDLTLQSAGQRHKNDSLRLMCHMVTFRKRLRSWLKETNVIVDCWQEKQSYTHCSKISCFVLLFFDSLVVIVIFNLNICQRCHNMEANFCQQKYSYYSCFVLVSQKFD